jgi:hypothetical protein
MSDAAKAPRFSSRVWRRMSADADAIGGPGREHAEAIFLTYMNSFETRDVTSRIALFANYVRFDDPADTRRASNKHELRSFFETAMPESWSMCFTLLSFALVGREAIVSYNVKLAAGTDNSSEMTVSAHVVFNKHLLITSWRTFFDVASIKPE